MTALIEIDDVTVRFGTDVVALNGCSLTVDEGEFVAVTGPSGSGKSTLLNIIGLLTSPPLAVTPSPENLPAGWMIGAGRPNAPATLASFSSRST